MEGEDPKVTYFGVKSTRGGWSPLVLNLTKNIDSPGRWDSGHAYVIILMLTDVGGPILIMAGITL